MSISLGQKNTMLKYLPVLKAWLQGGQLQSRGSCSSKPWKDINSPEWWHGSIYRIKPDVNMIDNWMNVYANDHNTIHKSRKHADKYAIHSRIACVHIQQECDVGEGL